MSARVLALFALLSTAACQQAVAPGGGALVSGETAGITSLAVDGDHVYFTTNDAVKRVALAGGEAETIASDQHNPSAIIVDADHSFWIGPGGVFRAPKAGGDVAQVGSGTGIVALTQDDANLFFTTDSQSALSKVVKTSGEQTALVSNVVGASQLAPLTGATLYFTDTTDLLQVSATGGEASSIFHGSGVNRLASSGSNVYYTAVGDRTVDAIAADGTTLVLASPMDVTDPSTNPTDDPEQTSTPMAVPQEIVADQLNVYWTAIDGSLNMVDAQGLSSPQQLASSVTAQNVHLTSDDATLYIANEKDGAIFAIPKPTQSF